MVAVGSAVVTVLPWAAATVAEVAAMVRPWVAAEGKVHVHAY